MPVSRMTSGGLGICSGQDRPERGARRRTGVGLAAGSVLQAVGVGLQVQVPVQVDLRAERRLHQRVDPRVVGVRVPPVGAHGDHRHTSMPWPSRRVTRTVRNELDVLGPAVRANGDRQVQQGQGVLDDVQVATPFADEAQQMHDGGGALLHHRGLQHARRLRRAHQRARQQQRQAVADQPPVLGDGVAAVGGEQRRRCGEHRTARLQAVEHDRGVARQPAGRGVRVPGEPVV